MDNILDLLLNNIIKSDDYYKITKKLNFLIKKIHLKNTGNTIIFFKKLSYSLNNLFEDILSFTNFETSDISEIELLYVKLNQEGEMNTVNAF